jgi:hypothetical protein
MTIRLLHDAGNDRKGAVLSVKEDRARRLIRTGYAEPVAESDEIPTRKRKAKE